MCRSRGEYRRPAIRRWPTSAGRRASTRNIQIFPISSVRMMPSRASSAADIPASRRDHPKNQASLKEKSRSPSGLSLYQRISRAGNRKIFDRAGRCASRTIIGVSFRFESFVVLWPIDCRLCPSYGRGIQLIVATTRCANAPDANFQNHRKLRLKSHSRPALSKGRRACNTS